MLWYSHLTWCDICTNLLWCSLTKQIPHLPYELNLYLCSHSYRTTDLRGCSDYLRFRLTQVLVVAILFDQWSSSYRQKKSLYELRTSLQRKFWVSLLSLPGAWRDIDHYIFVSGILWIDWDGPRRRKSFSRQQSGAVMVLWRRLLLLSLQFSIWVWKHQVSHWKCFDRSHSCHFLFAIMCACRKWHCWVRRHKFFGSRQFFADLQASWKHSCLIGSFFVQLGEFFH